MQTIYTEAGKRAGDAAFEGVEPGPDGARRATMEFDTIKLRRQDGKLAIDFSLKGETLMILLGVLPEFEQGDTLTLEGFRITQTITIA